MFKTKNEAQMYKESIETEYTDPWLVKVPLMWLNKANTGKKIMMSKKWKEQTVASDNL